MSEFSLYRLQLFFPYPEELPVALLADADGVSQADARARYADMPLVRVAKFDGAVLGVYAMQQRDPLHYELITLVVDRGWRNRGIAGWLLGHAIGVAESKGARTLTTCIRHDGTLFTRIGFVPQDNRLCFTLIPE